LLLFWRVEPAWLLAMIGSTPAARIVQAAHQRLVNPVNGQTATAAVKS